MEKNALFLGGTKGLGLEMAKLAVAEEMEVMIAGRTAKECSLVNEGKALGARIDLTDGRNGIEPLLYFHRAFDVMVWSAGIHQQGSFTDLGVEDVARYTRTHFEGPVAILANFLKANKTAMKPCHLVVIGSSSAYKARADQSVYCALKAAKAQLARALGKELPGEKSIPGSKVLLAHPGGMNTPFWKGREDQAVGFMDPAAVAAIIWEYMKQQTEPFCEIHIDRQSDGSAKLDVGTRMPE
ncbi:MAG: SDR family oxidoreductase [Patescibacteria group bacterium]